MSISCIIPAKSESDPNLKLLIDSIKAQNYPQDQVEILVITEGNSEEAKAIGIRHAKHDICAMFCADNEIVHQDLFSLVEGSFEQFPELTGVYTKHYHVDKKDNLVNSYFSLLGANDVVPFFLGKCDRLPYTKYSIDEKATFFSFKYGVPSLGDNGFFFKRKYLLDADLDHYYPMDICEDLRQLGHNMYLRLNIDAIWHKTSSNIFSFLSKRNKYAESLYLNQFIHRRWRMIDGKQEWVKLLFWSAMSIIIIPDILYAIHGYLRYKHRAWFLHPIVCLLMVISYTWMFLTWKLSRALSFRH